MTIAIRSASLSYSYLHAINVCKGLWKPLDSMEDDFYTFFGGVVLIFFGNNDIFIKWSLTFTYPLESFSNIYVLLLVL